MNLQKAEINYKNGIIMGSIIKKYNKENFIKEITISLSINKKTNTPKTNNYIIKNAGIGIGIGICIGIGACIFYSKLYDKTTLKNNLNI